MTSNPRSLIQVIVACTAPFVAAGCVSPFQQHRDAARQLMNEGRFGAALGPLEAARQMVPEHADTLCDLAECHLALAGNYRERDDQLAAHREIDRALNYYRRAIRSYPGSMRALRGRNLALRLRGDHEEALAAARWSVENVGPSVEQQLFLARELAERGDADRALLAYKQAVAMEPQSPTAHWALGLFYLDLERPAEGISHLQHAYRLDPGRSHIAEKLRALGAEVPMSTLYVPAVPVPTG